MVVLESSESSAETSAAVTLNPLTVFHAASAAASSSSSSQDAASPFDMPAEHVLRYECDFADRDKPHMVVDYADEMYKYYKESEVRSFKTTQS